MSQSRRINLWSSWRLRWGVHFQWVYFPRLSSLFRSHAARRWAGTARHWFKGCWLSSSLILACAYALGHRRFPFDSSGELAWMLVWCDQWDGWCGRALLGQHFLWRYVVDFFALLSQDTGQNRRNDERPIPSWKRGCNKDCFVVRGLTCVLVSDVQRETDPGLR